MKQASYLAQYAALRGLVGLSAPLPLPAKRAVVGGAFARAMPALAKLRRTADANLRLAFPDMEEPARRALIRDVARNVGATLCNMWHPEAFAREIADVTPEGPGLAVLREARARGQGAVILSGHFGQFEAFRRTLKREGLETGGIYRPNNNARYDGFWLPRARANGTPVIPTGREGQKQLAAHLRDGGFVVILVDQAIRQGVPIDFLGHPAMTSPGAAILARRYGALLTTAWGPVVEGRQRVIYDAPIEEEDPVEALAEYNRRLGDWVRREPAQWHWFHNRWKGPPKPKSKAPET